MTLDEAIDNLSSATTRYPHILDDDALEAMKLGIEALKRCQELKKYTVQANYMPLPGETER